MAKVNNDIIIEIQDGCVIDVYREDGKELGFNYTLKDHDTATFCDECGNELNDEAILDAHAISDLEKRGEDVMYCSCCKHPHEDLNDNDICPDCE